MDISNWGWGQILELPDHLFGRRRVIGCSGFLTTVGVTYDISEAALPDKCVIWEAQVKYVAGITGYGSVSLALSDQIPTTDPQFNLLEQVFPDIGYPIFTRRDFAVNRGSAFALRRLKIGLDTSGRRLTLRFASTFDTISKAEVELVVSSVPRSLPEWFV